MPKVHPHAKKWPMPCDQDWMELVHWYTMEDKMLNTFVVAALAIVCVAEALFFLKWSKYMHVNKVCLGENTEKNHPGGVPCWDVCWGTSCLDWDFSPCLWKTIDPPASSTCQRTLFPGPLSIMVVFSIHTASQQFIPGRNVTMDVLHYLRKDHFYSSEEVTQMREIKGTSVTSIETF